MQFVQNCPSCRRTECFENISHSATIGKSRLACQGAAIAVAPLSRPSPNIWTRTYSRLGKLTERRWGNVRDNFSSRAISPSDWLLFYLQNKEREVVMLWRALAPGFRPPRGFIPRFIYPPSRG